MPPATYHRTLGCMAGEHGWAALATLDLLGIALAQSPVVTVDC